MGTWTQQEGYPQPLTKGEIEARLAADVPLDPPRITVEEYLRTSYRPDRELIDGELKEKSMPTGILPTRLHGYVQAMISHWFGLHMDEWGIAPESEVCTRVRPGNFRLPDISVTPLHEFEGRTQDTPPIIAIEILSDDDRFSDLARRAADFRAMGVEHVWLVDPEQRTALLWAAKGVWEPAAQLQVPGTPIHLDLPWLWAQVEKRAARV